MRHNAANDKENINSKINTMTLIILHKWTSLWDQFRWILLW